MTLTLDQLPTVSIVILNYNGKSHLDTCFQSLQQLDYPADKVEIMFVDNGSKDGSEEHVRQHWPELTIIQNNANLGFAEGNNVGARQSQQDVLVFVNNDTRVEPDWLTELVTPLLEADDVACSASKMVSWDGTQIDFVGANLNFYGIADQEAWRMPVEAEGFDQSGEMLMACGGSMAIWREVFLDVGGFDKHFQVYYEDVDLGWRLWILGYRVVFAPKAITYHRHHSTSTKVSYYRRLFLYERNAMYMVLKNYEDANLGKALPAALMLAIHRTTSAIEAAGVSPQTFNFEQWEHLSPSTLKQSIPLTTTIPILAVQDLLANLPRVMEQRAEIQSKRRRSDTEILPLFRQPARHHITEYMMNSDYPIAQNNLISAFGLDALFENIGKKILLFSPVGLPRYGFPTSAIGARIEMIGEALERQGHRVVYSMPLAEVQGRELPINASEVLWDRNGADQLILRQLPDVVVAFGWHALESIHRGSYRPIIVDLTGTTLDVPAHHRAAFVQAYGLKTVDMFISADHKATTIQAWLKQQKIDVAAEMIATVDLSPSQSSAEIDAAMARVFEFCLAPTYTTTKPANPEPTPFYELPLKAIATVVEAGPNVLFREVMQYVRWRIDLLTR